MSQSIINWKTWCRLCGDFEETDKIDSEVSQIAELFFELPAESSFICIDCKAYCHDLQNFLIKAKNVNSMFQEIEQIESDGEACDEMLLSIRHSYNLKLLEIDFIEANDVEMSEELREIENFKIIEEDEVEYLVEPEADEIVESETTPAIDYEEKNFLYEDFPEDFEAENEEKFTDLSQVFDFTCHVCLDKFTKMCFLSVHTKTVHNCLPSVKCRCGRLLGSIKSIMEHFDDHIAVNTPNFRCQDCNKNYKTQANYNNHMMNHHRQDTASVRKFTCKTCGKSFKESRHLAVHETSHLPDELKFTHACSYCDKKLASVFSLRQHIKHVHVKEPVFNCPECDKTFSRKANLDSHVNHVHTTERNFECDICGLRVKTKGILRVHKKIHSDDFLTCQVCSRQFKTQNQLTNHLITHSNVKRYKCSSCNAEYKRSKELSSHIASVHTGEIKYTCEWCPKTFFNNSNFRKHKIKMHSEKLVEVRKDEHEIYVEEVE